MHDTDWNKLDKERLASAQRDYDRLVEYPGDEPVNIAAENFQLARDAAKELRDMAGQIITPKNSPTATRFRRLADGIEYVIRMAEIADDAILEAEIARTPTP